MDQQRFDQLAMFLATGVTRRRILQATAATVAVLVAHPLSGMAVVCETDDNCAGNEYCDNGFCLEPGSTPPGEPCDGITPCEDPYLCIKGICSSPVTCQFNAGEACDPAGGCCPGLVCDDQGMCQVEQTGGGDGGGDGGDIPVDNGGGQTGGGGSQSGGGDTGQESSSSGNSGQGNATTSSAVRLPTTGAGSATASGNAQIGFVAALAALSTVAAVRLGLRPRNRTDH